MGWKYYMTEQEFIIKLTELGYDEESIKEIMQVIIKMRKTNPNITYNELLEFAIEVHKEDKNEPKGFLSF
jgi:hypothetical protein